MNQRTSKIYLNQNTNILTHNTTNKHVSFKCVQDLFFEIGNWNFKKQAYISYSAITGISQSKASQMITTHFEVQFFIKNCKDNYTQSCRGLAEVFEQSCKTEAHSSYYRRYCISATRISARTLPISVSHAGVGLCSHREF